MPVPSIDQHIARLDALLVDVQTMKARIDSAIPTEVERLHALATTLDAEIQANTAIAQLIIAASYLESRWSDR